MQVLGPNQLRPEITRRQQAMDEGLSMVLGGIGQIDQNKKQQAETQRQRAMDMFNLEKSFAEKGVSLDDNQKQIAQNYVQTGDTKGLSAILGPLSQQAQSDRKIKKEQDAQAKDLERRYKESFIQKNMNQSGGKNIVQQKQLNSLADQTVKLSGVYSGLSQSLAQLKNPNLTEDEKIKLSQETLKLLNSAEGSDAVGAEEAKRMGDLIEYKIANFTGPGSFMGRDLDLFTDQLENNLNRIAGRISDSEANIEKISRGEKLTPAQTKKMLAESKSNEKLFQVGAPIQKAVAGGDNALKSAPTDSLMRRREEILRKKGLK